AGMTPVRRDDEKYTADGESEPRDDRPRSGEFELRDLCGGQPDAREQNEQEADFGQASAAADISLRLSLQRPRMPRGRGRGRVSASPRRCRVWLSNPRSSDPAPGLMIAARAITRALQGGQHVE